MMRRPNKTSQLSTEHFMGIVIILLSFAGEFLRALTLLTHTDIHTIQEANRGPQ